MEEKNNILTSDIQSIVVEKEETHEKIAEITNECVTPANGYVVRITPNYD